MGTTLHTLKGPKGATTQPQAHRPRAGLGHGRAAGQGRQGAEGPHRAPRRALRLRGRSDADAAPLPEARFQEPVPQGDLAVNLGELESASPAGTVDQEALQGAGMVPRSSKA